MGLWVLLLIRCSTFTFLSDMGHITHTCTQHSPSSVSPSIHHTPPSSRSSYLLVLLMLLSQQTGRLPQSYPSSNRGSDTTVGSQGGLGTVHIEPRITVQVRDTPHFYPNLKAMSLWVLLLIRCSTFTFLSEVGHITHTCTQQLSMGSIRKLE